jgi:alpha-2-macroglobulin
VAVALSAAENKLQLPKGRKTEVTIPVTAAGLGTAQFAMTLRGGGTPLTQDIAVRVQPSSQSVANRVVRTLPAGGSLTVGTDLLSDVLPGSGSIAVSASPFTALDVPALLKALDRYPYGCTEQTISRAMPLLYVNRLANLEQLAIDDTAGGRVQAALDRILARQGANGSFGLWGVGGDDIWLDAFVGDFLTRARETGQQVPATSFNLMLDRLRNKVVNITAVDKAEAHGIAYALYVLARNGRPIMGDLRYIADNEMKNMPTAMARAHVAAALALLGDRGRARSVFTQAIDALVAERPDMLSRPDYGSKLRDGSGLLTMLAENGGERAEIMRVAAEVDSARNAYRYTSTQEQNWMVMAAQALAKEVETFQLQVNGQARSGAFYRTYRQAELESGPLTITNPGQAPTRVVLTVTGMPLSPEPQVAQGFTIERSIHTMKGQAADWSRLRQNERYVVHLKVTETRGDFGRVMVVDPLPSGLEIENAKLTEGVSVEGLAFTKSDATPVHVESRDDRFVAAFDRSSSPGTRAFSVSYIVRAVTPGRYVHAGAFIEDMYRPDRFGRGASGTVEVQSAR